ncbi:hypothetical protein GCM10023310_27750 [Paenibacillus vulneris]|uniref:Metallophosphoesterase n=1 Tax=Paenibacillus vulneris TaxID=1133364 RepID=A0ABW3USQ5_9BACL
MNIGFVGDIHGRVLHAIALLAEWQQRTGRRLDLIIQVGDLGAYPNPDEKLLNEKYVRLDPAELDFSRMLKAEGELADRIRGLREHELNPIYFIRGNHEDFDWLDSISRHSSGTVTVDPFDLFRYIKDGTIMEVCGMKIAFLGGIQTKEHEQKSINPEAYEKLLRQPPGEIDILITHDAPYGIGTSYIGETQGSTLISQLIDNIQPKYAIGGHYHHRIGPKMYGSTTYLGLNVLIDLRKDGALRQIKSGCMAVLDTESDHVDFVIDSWLSHIDKDFEFVSYMRKLGSHSLQEGSNG